MEIHGGDFARQPTVWFECAWQPTVLDLCGDILGPGVCLGYECDDIYVYVYIYIYIYTHT